MCRAEVTWLRQRNHEPLKFREGVVLRPAEKYLVWHRENIFQQS